MKVYIIENDGYIYGVYSEFNSLLNAADTINGDGEIDELMEKITECRDEDSGEIAFVFWHNRGEYTIETYEAE